MKKVIMLLIVLAFVAFGRVGTGDCKILRIDFTEGGQVVVITNRMPSDASALYFNSGDKMAKYWTAALLTAQANDQSIYMYYHEDYVAAKGYRKISKIELK